jgi:hypothetical protein
MIMQELSAVFPRMVTLRQTLYQSPLDQEGVIAAVRREFGKLELQPKIGPGKTVALGGGSRGVASIDLIIKTLVEEVKKLGGEPFVFPAMGSHGGGTAEGQREVLESLGITEDYVGCPIKSSMETVELGKSPSGLSVYLDKNASQADAIIIINRVKAHTNFRGEVESGLMKMLAIGAGKHNQAIAIHSYGVKGLSEYIPEVGQALLERAPVVAGFAVLEDAYHSASRIMGVAPQDFYRVETELLKEANRTSPSLPAKDIDVLIVEQMGKNISGAGMDTNVIGRVYLPDNHAWDEPRIKVIIVLNLTEETHGNAVGIGMADLIVKRVADKIDFQKTYINAITGGGPLHGALPITCQTDREAVRIALDYLIGPQPSAEARVVRIKDTLTLDQMQVSEALLSELRGRDGFSFEGTPTDMSFNENGELE